MAQFEYIQNPEEEKPNENDKKYLAYSELIIKAKECGVGYFCDREDTLHLVPVPIISCDEQNRYHSDTEPAIKWEGEEIYYLHGVKFEKEWWEKIKGDTLTPDEIFAIDNAEHRRIAYEYMDKAKMKTLKDYQVLDEIENDGYGNPMKVISFTVQNMKVPLKFLNVFCSTSKREYFLGTDKTKCWEAKSALAGLEEAEWIKEW